MNLLHQLHRHAADRPEQLALRECCSGKTLTYRELDRAVADFAHKLCGDIAATFVLQCGNRVEFHIALLGCLSAGHGVFPMACDSVQAEVNHAIKCSGARGLIRHDLQPCAQSCGPSAVGEPALLLQSSGTTGLPKIVCRPATTLDASARQIVQSIGLNSDDHILVCVPLSHSYGIEHGLLAAIDAGAAVHLTQGFDIGLIGRELIRSEITVLPAVPAVFEMLSQFHDLPTRFPHLRLAYSAGGPLPVRVNEAFCTRFGCRIGQVYGASEIGSVTFADPREVAFDPLSVGRAMPGVEMKVDADSQLFVRARSQMRGYLHGETPFTSEGFFPTGDLAAINNDGRLTLTGRLKLLVDVGGRKVNPLEVEQTIKQHPGVAECIVVSVRQTETLRRLKALIIPTFPQSPPSPDELRQFLKDRLSPYKIPRVFECRTSFPRSSAGKIQRQLLETA